MIIARSLVHLLLFLALVLPSVRAANVPALIFVSEVKTVKLYDEPEPGAPGKMWKRLHYRQRSAKMWADGTLEWEAWGDRESIIERGSMQYTQSDNRDGPGPLIGQLEGKPFREYTDAAPPLAIPVGLVGEAPIAAIVPSLGFQRYFQVIRPTGASGLSITTQPLDIPNRTSGNPLSLSVIACGLGKLQYQWFKDGQAIPGATSSNYWKDISEPSDSGTYFVRISNLQGAIDSDSAVVNISGLGSRIDVGGGDGIVRGRVWDDGDGIGDGIYEGERAVRDLRVTLLKYGDSTTWVVETNFRGVYEFVGVPAGTYDVFFDVPGGEKTTRWNVGDDESVDSDAHTFPSGPTNAATGSFEISGAQERVFDMGLVTVPNVYWQNFEINVFEGSADREIAVEVFLSYPSDDDITVPWTTSIGTAVFREDYPTRFGFLNFAPGETRKVVEIGIVGDRREEPDEFFFVELLVNPLQRVASDRPEMAINITNDDEGAAVEEPLPGQGIPQEVSDWSDVGWVVDAARSSEGCTVWRCVLAGVDGAAGRTFLEGGTLAFQWQLQSSDGEGLLVFGANGGIDELLSGDSGGWQPVVVQIGAGDVPVIFYLGTGPDDDHVPLVKNLRFVPFDPDSNVAPKFTSEPPMEAGFGQAYTYTPVVNDLDGDAVTLTVPVRPAWLNFDGATLSGTPPPGENRIDEVEVVATDARSAVAKQRFGILVSDGAPSYRLRWRLEKFEADAGDPTIADGRSDPDSDGVDNDAELGLGLNPLIPDRQRSNVRVQGVPGGGASVRLSIPADPPPGAVYSLEKLVTSTGQWQAVATRAADGTWGGSVDIGREREIGDRCFLSISDPGPSGRAIYRIKVDQ